MVRWTTYGKEKYKTVILEMPQGGFWSLQGQKGKNMILKTPFLTGLLINKKERELQ